MKNVATWLKVTLATGVVIWLLAVWLAPVGDFLQSTGNAVGQVAPAIGKGLRSSSRSAHNTICEQTGKCDPFPASTAP